MFLSPLEITNLIEKLKKDYPSLYEILKLVRQAIGADFTKNPVLYKDAISTIHVFLGAIPFYLNKAHNGEDYMTLGTLQAEDEPIAKEMFNHLQILKKKQEREQYCIAYLYNIIHGKTFNMYDELINHSSEFNLRHISKSTPISKENADKLITSHFQDIMVKVFDNYDAFYEVAAVEEIPATPEQDRLATNIAMLRAIEEQFIVGKKFPLRRPLVQAANKELYPSYASFYELAENVKANIWAYLLGVLQIHSLAKATAIENAIKRDPNYLLSKVAFEAIQEELVAIVARKNDRITAFEINTFLKLVPILEKVQATINDVDQQYSDINALISTEKEALVKKNLLNLTSYIVDTQNALISGKALIFETGKQTLSKTGSFLIKADSIKLNSDNQLLSKKLLATTQSLIEEPGKNLLLKIQHIQLKAIDTMSNVAAKNSSLLNVLLVNEEQRKNNIYFSRHLPILIKRLESDITTLDDDDRMAKTKHTCRAIADIYQKIHCDRTKLQRIFDSQGRILADNLKGIFDSIVNLADIIQDEPLKQAILKTIPTKDNNYQLRVSPVA